MITARSEPGTRLERMLACTSPDAERTIMGAVDDSHYSLVIAAAQAAGPCPPGGGGGVGPPGPRPDRGPAPDRSAGEAGHRAAGVGADLHRVPGEGRDRGIEPPR